MINDFVKLCHLYGGLDELVQAGGGNISIKYIEHDTQKIIIKASGYNLSDVTFDKGYSILDCNCANLNIFYGEKPSIETYFHLFLNKYTVHLHPTLINIFMCSNSKLPVLAYNHITIDYYKPGLDLSNEIKKKYNNENIIFLKNHGVIFTHDDIEILKKIINNCYYVFSNYKLSDYENIFYSHPNKNIMKIDYKIILPIIPYTPDIVIYLFNSILNYNNETYIISDTKYKCYQILEVLKSYIILNNNNNLTPICYEEVQSLLLRDDEKYRLNKI
ncbi:putative class II aldolase [Bodo saltans virus]|uniref:Class II aldolase n=1 Tax=Bodo saltans virus TaxID=2024608 RepID=A0A2H4UUW4_9VIRU|nr:putative class II aldolase [Bodo saltans virus]ATZ80615.1 putative class II aldolase [Bodo saltans virus]